MFIVMRTYSRPNPASKVLWEVVSRQFQRKEDAESWKNFVEMEYKEDYPKGKQRYFVIETEFEDLFG